VDERDKPPKLFGCDSLNNLEILLVIEKLDKIYQKKLVILPKFLGENRAVSY